MVQTFNTNSSRDIFIGSDGNLSIATAQQGVLKACESASYAQLGEMVLATGLGVPNRETVWVGVPNYPLYELYLRQTLLSVEGVTNVKSLQISENQDVLSYVATIETIYDTDEISGTLTNPGA